MSEPDYSYFSHNHALVRLVHEFNILPSRYIHPSWLVAVMGRSLADAVLNSKRSEKILSAWIISELKNEFYYDFEDVMIRLVLLDSTNLQKLIIYTGVAINAPRISKIIEGNKIQDLKRKFGEEVYRFALKRAPLMIGKMSFSFTEAGQRDDLPVRILTFGTKAVQICLGGLPDALVNRFIRKFSKNMDWDFSFQASPEEKKSVWQLMRKIILQEIDSQWNPILS